MYLKRYFILLIFFANILHSTAKPVDISEASIFISKDIKAKVQNSSVKILQEEVSKRSGFTWQKIDKWKDSRTYTIALALSSTKKLDGRTPPVNSDQNAPEFQAEGYRIKMTDEVIWIMGADSRAIIFGIGELLRTVKMEKGQVMIDADLNIGIRIQFPPVAGIRYPGCPHNRKGRKSNVSRPGNNELVRLGYAFTEDILVLQGFVHSVMLQNLHRGPAIGGCGRIGECHMPDISLQQGFHAESRVVLKRP